MSSPTTDVAATVLVSTTAKSEGKEVSITTSRFASETPAVTSNVTVTKVESSVSASIGQETSQSNTASSVAITSTPNVKSETITTRNQPTLLDEVLETTNAFTIEKDINASTTVSLAETITTPTLADISTDSATENLDRQNEITESIVASSYNSMRVSVSYTTVIISASTTQQAIPQSSFAVEKAGQGSTADDITDISNSGGGPTTIHQEFQKNSLGSIQNEQATVEVTPDTVTKEDSQETLITGTTDNLESKSSAGSNIVYVSAGGGVLAAAGVLAGVFYLRRRRSASQEVSSYIDNSSSRGDVFAMMTSPLQQAGGFEEPKPEAKDRDWEW